MPGLLVSMLSTLNFSPFLIFLLATIDFLLLRGTFLILPAISLLFYGNLEGTYWGCEDWVSVEEGSYCADKLWE